jgi:hypothetical protein
MSPNVDWAFAYASPGEDEKAMEYLLKAAEERSNQLWVNLGSPQFDSLRPDPRFQRLMAVLLGKAKSIDESKRGE